MAKGASAGVVRVPNYSTGPLLTITGNVAFPTIPNSALTQFNGGTNPYVRALMWEAKGFRNWTFYITSNGGSFTAGATNGVTIWGTNDDKTVTGVNMNWFKLQVDSAGGGGPTPANPMVNSGDGFGYHEMLSAIAVTVGGFLSGPWNLVAAARD